MAGVRTRSRGGSDAVRGELPDVHGAPASADAGWRRGVGLCLSGEMVPGDIPRMREFCSVSRRTARSHWSPHIFEAAGYGRGCRILDLDLTGIRPVVTHRIGDRSGIFYNEQGRLGGAGDSAERRSSWASQQDLGNPAGQDWRGVRRSG